MSRKNPKKRGRKLKSAHDFRISDAPVVRSETAPNGVVGELENLPVLPVHGAPVLAAIARDPRTILLYWTIDWPALFVNTVPPDRQAHLRIYSADASEEKSVAVEPMVGNCYVTVPQRGGRYHAQIGYYHPADVWHSITTSNEVTMPQGDFAANRGVDLATIPFHLKFQRLHDLLGAANSAPLAEIISRLQTRALPRQPDKLPSAQDGEILRAMNLSVDEIAAARRSFISGANEAVLDRLTEGILSSGSTSPWRGFSPSSW